MMMAACGSVAHRRYSFLRVKRAVMARPEIQQLYRELYGNHFEFMERGEHSIEEIYDAVKAGYLALCDDTYLCSMNCSHGHDRPEWQHTVRKALSDLKRRGSGVASGYQRGRWQFLER